MTRFFSTQMGLRQPLCLLPRGQHRPETGPAGSCAVILGPAIDLLVETGIWVDRNRMSVAESHSDILFFRISETFCKHEV